MPVLSWLSAHFMDVVVAVVAVDAAFIPLFPQVGMLIKVRDVLGGLVPKKPAA